MEKCRSHCMRKGRHSPDSPENFGGEARRTGAEETGKEDDGAEAAEEASSSSSSRRSWWSRSGRRRWRQAMKSSSRGLSMTASDRLKQQSAEDVTLDCRFEFPRDVTDKLFEWMFGSQRVLVYKSRGFSRDDQAAQVKDRAHPDSSIDLTTGKLPVKISSVQTNDAGTYSCSVGIIIDRISCSTELIVEPKPEATKGADDEKVVQHPNQAPELDRDTVSHVLSSQAQKIHAHENQLKAIATGVQQITERQDRAQQEVSAQVSQLGAQLQRIASRLDQLTPSQPTSPATPPPASPSASAIYLSRPARLAPPEKYSGEPGQCRPFLVQCELHFQNDPAAFASDEAQVAFMISHLSGKSGGLGYGGMGSRSCDMS
ncbi:hypothetical protein L3Q82_003802 [Scortum barcoo]|uniref:Uncharacterized protein n=1 Tax=Scortum barcoo TaxID=214431 RepID=A0ACB8X5B8_9TELE|nr:hypothetical protein L3Q82_003802 [Scortum barcoo]